MTRWSITWLWVGGLLILLALTACTSTPSTPSSGSTAPTEATPDDNPTLTVTSSAFAYGEPIPVRYTCDGANVSPPLSWSGAPSHTRAFVLIVDDPDAPMGTWLHWLIYDIPATTHELAEGASDVGVVGLNSWQQPGYGGPCPPPGKPHRYFFRLYALDSPLNLPPGASRQEVERAMQGHVLAQGEWMGTYRR